MHKTFFYHVLLLPPCHAASGLPENSPIPPRFLRAIQSQAPLCLPRSPHKTRIRCDSIIPTGIMAWWYLNDRPSARGVAPIRKRKEHTTDSQEGLRLQRSPRPPWQFKISPTPKLVGGTLNLFLDPGMYSLFKEWRHSSSSSILKLPLHAKRIHSPNEKLGP